MEAVLTPVSIGELVDKITILQIKAERIEDPTKLANVCAELAGLLPLWQPLEAGAPTLLALKVELKAINERMWDIQDGLRGKEAAQQFDDEFIRLARSVHSTNEARVNVKNTVNRLAGSRFVEEKQYKA